MNETIQFFNINASHKFYDILLCFLWGTNYVIFVLSVDYFSQVGIKVPHLYPQYFLRI